MHPIRLRMVEETDAAAIARIYAPYVTDSPASFETTPPDATEIRARIRAVSARYPYLAAVSGEEIAGYAYANRDRERAAYQWNAVLSVYVAEAFQRRGLGLALSTALLEILRLQKIQNAYGNVTLPNPASVGLLERLGFRSQGVFRRTGYKCGRWCDVEWFEKHIGDFGNDPEPPLSIKEVDCKAVARILEESAGLCASLDALSEREGKRGC